MVHDPNTSTTISDSFEIAKYLERTYPVTPTLFPEGTAAFQAAVLDVVAKDVGITLAMNIPYKRIGLSERSLAHIEAFLVKRFGSLENLGGEIFWKQTEDALGKLRGWLSANGPGKDTFLMGDRVCFADFQIASALLSFKIVCGENSEQWERVCGWHDGKWKAYLKEFEPYMTVAEDWC